jgi:quercetin 2,3-dioxygenase
MEIKIRKNEERGKADYGWLKARYSFSFASYYNPSNIHFGLLRVLNDDIVAPGAGFPTHPHDNMEIITIPLEGELEHKDDLGSGSIISPGEVQVMSAGRGITHSEFNPSKTNPVNLLQIWIFPSEKNVNPRYDQKKFSHELLKDNFLTVVSPEKSSDALWINQDAWLSLGEFKNIQETEYTINKKGNGAFVFMIEGKTEIEGNLLQKRDSASISNADKITFKNIENAKILIIEVPMN